MRAAWPAVIVVVIEGTTSATPPRTHRVDLEVVGARDTATGPELLVELHVESLSVKRGTFEITSRVAHDGVRARPDFEDGPFELDEHGRSTVAYTIEALPDGYYQISVEVNLDDGEFPKRLSAFAFFAIEDGIYLEYELGDWYAEAALLSRTRVPPQWGQCRSPTRRSEAAIIRRVSESVRGERAWYTEGLRATCRWLCTCQSPRIRHPTR